MRRLTPFTVFRTGSLFLQWILPSIRILVKLISNYERQAQKSRTRAVLAGWDDLIDISPVIFQSHTRDSVQYKSYPFRIPLEDYRMYCAKVICVHIPRSYGLFPVNPVARMSSSPVVLRRIVGLAKFSHTALYIM